MVLLGLVSFLVSLLVLSVCVRFTSGHARRYSEQMPQRFHSGHVPRLGGLGLLIGMSAAWILVYYSGARLNVQVPWGDIWTWLAMLLPAWAGGLAEDLTQRLRVSYRLVLTASSALLACWLLGLQVHSVGIPLIDSAITAWPVLAWGIAFLAVCGLPHSFNIIDGYNGLAATVALLICLALVHVALQVGDRQLAAMVICLAGATLGFLFWNYPRGLIFAGDGGAYLWGTVIAVASVALTQRNPQVSPWFPMLLLIYPVWETLFSIYRKLSRGTSPGVADALHFHQLIYRRLVRTVFHDDEPRRMLMRNNRTSPYLWGFTLLSVVPAVLFWHHTEVLMGLCLLFIVTYVVAYVGIVRFKVPPWLRH